MTTMASFTPSQTAYAFYLDGTESASVLFGAASTAAEKNADRNINLLLRIRVQETGGASGATTDDWQLQFDKNASGSWTSITTSSASVKAFASASLTDGGATTNRLGSGTGSFVAGEISEDGLVDDHQLTASNFTEYLFALTIVAADVSSGDVLTFRLLHNGATFTYSVTPQLTVRKFTATAIDPSTLTLDAWYDPSDLSTLKQNSDGTGAVTTAGDPVGYMADKSGNGRHLLQATSGSRPTYQVDSNGKPYLLFDGTDDYLVLNPMAISLPVDWVAGVRQLTWVSGAMLFRGASTTNMSVQQSAATPSLRMDGGPQTDKLPVGENGVVTAQLITNASEIGVNTCAQVAGSVGIDLAFFSIGATQTGTSPSNMRFYGAVVDNLGSNLAGVQTWMAQKTGQIDTLAASVGSAAGTGTASATGAPISASSGSAAATGSASGVGSSTASFDGNSAGLGAASGVGVGVAVSSSSASGTGAATGSGAGVVSASGSASGTGAAAGSGVGVAASPGSASGTGAATGASSTAISLYSGPAAVGVSPIGSDSVGGGSSKSQIPSSGSASGTGAATGSGVGVAVSTGSAAGTGAASGVGQAQAVSQGSAAGVGAAAGTGVGVAISTGSSSGAGEVSASSVAIGVMQGSASGVGSASGAGATAGAEQITGSAAGVGAASGEGVGVAISSGSAAGAGVAAGTGQTEALSQGSSAGAGSAAAAAVQIVEASGSASSIGAASSTGTAVQIASGSSAGTGGTVIDAIAIFVAAGSSAGVGAASATATAFSTGVAMSAGFGVAVGDGFSIAMAAGSASGTGAAVADGTDASNPVHLFERAVIDLTTERIVAYLPSRHIATIDDAENEAILPSRIAVGG